MTLSVIESAATERSPPALISSTGLASAESPGRMAVAGDHGAAADRPCRDTSLTHSRDRVSTGHRPEQPSYLSTQLCVIPQCLLDLLPQRRLRVLIARLGNRITDRFHDRSRPGAFPPQDQPQDPAPDTRCRVRRHLDRVILDVVQHPRAVRTQRRTDKRPRLRSQLDHVLTYRTSHPPRSPP